MRERDFIVEYIVLDFQSSSKINPTRWRFQNMGDALDCYHSNYRELKDILLESNDFRREEHFNSYYYVLESREGMLYIIRMYVED